MHTQTSASLPRCFILSSLITIGLVAQPAASAATIQAGPAYRLSSIHMFVASGAAGDTIQWYLDRRLTDEGNGSVLVTTALDSARGTEFAAPLLHVAGKRTEYTLRARDSGGEDAVTIRVFPPGVASTLVYVGPNNPTKPVRVFVVAPSGLDPSSRIVTVMHGVDRNADDYIGPWTAFATALNRVVIAPEFTATLWPSSRSYNLGNMFTASDTTGSPIPEPQWSFSVLQEIIASIRQGFALNDSLYDIWGHSAGAQFVHRMVLMKPDAPIRVAIAANAGSYTVPDTAVVWPYGALFSQLGVRTAELLRFTMRPLVVMRGTADTLRDANLDTSPLADLQGLNRFERAATFFATGKARNPDAAWALYDVPGVGHDFEKMSLPAQELLAGVWPPPHRPLLYAQSFGASPSLPQGWTITGPGWAPSLSSPSLNYVGASGGVNLAASNGGGTAVSVLTLSGLPAINGGVTIGVRWGGRRSASFTNAVTFEWCPDGSTWTEIPYTQVPNTTTWMHVNNGNHILIPIPPSGAPQPAFRWTFTQANNGGVYRFDDFELADATVTGIVPPHVEAPPAFSLLQNYPNPFNPVTTIRYSVASPPAVGGEAPAGGSPGGPGRVRLAVYDLLGREVAVLTDGPHQPGVYQVRFDANGLASGVYFSALQAGGSRTVRAMLLLR